MSVATHRLRAFGEELHRRSAHFTRRPIPATLLVALLGLPVDVAFGRRAGLWAALPAFRMLCGFVVACGVAAAGFGAFTVLVLEGGACEAR
jgi:hypothetical protein